LQRRGNGDERECKQAVRGCAAARERAMQVLDLTRGSDWRVEAIVLEAAAAHAACHWGGVHVMVYRAWPAITSTATVLILVKASSWAAV
jgi:hypothetical protein